MATFNDYIRGLSEVELAIFADRAGTSTGYIKAHLIGPNGPRKRASHDLMRRLVDASNGALTWADVRDWFYPEPVGFNGDAA